MKNGYEREYYDLDELLDIVVNNNKLLMKKVYKIEKYIRLQKISTLALSVYLGYIFYEYYKGLKVKEKMAKEPSPEDILS